MTTPYETPAARRSLNSAELQRFGFGIDPDPLTGANAALAQSFFFVRPARGTTPPLRLQIVKGLSGEWNVVIMPADHGDQSMLDNPPRFYSQQVPPDSDAILRTIETAVADIEQRFERFQIERQQTATADDINRCLNCNRPIDDAAKYCGKWDCEDKAAKR